MGEIGAPLPVSENGRCRVWNSAAYDGRRDDSCNIPPKLGGAKPPNFLCSDSSSDEASASDSGEERRGLLPFISEVLLFCAPASPLTSPAGDGCFAVRVLPLEVGGASGEEAPLNRGSFEVLLSDMLLCYRIVGSGTSAPICRSGTVAVL